MTHCELFDVPDIELYFYGELPDADRPRVDAHLRRCGACRQRLDDLRAIRRALADRPVVDAPPTGDWSGFMRRLGAAVSQSSAPDQSAHPMGSRSAPSAARTSIRFAAAAAAMVAIVGLGIFAAFRVRQAAPTPRQTANVEVGVPSTSPPPVVRTPDSSLREVTAEHLERSKLVVLGLTALDPKQTHTADWQYERRLAGTLLDDTRLYREMAQERGMDDVARVMRDLETVLIEASMSDTTDREALSRVQRLIAKRDLVVRMQLVAAN
ncbi:MAG TPA: zf-HC2 domain-containing protein [Vicinamibacterales bacterium]|jgi:hypothetical protein|nr:zf-HC2 domain-containing protein [Vicinamibacterales bacterium]